jgi:hypothetical protein
VETYVGDAVIDALMIVETDAPVATCSIASRLDPGLPGQEDAANLVLDHGPGGSEAYRARGLLTQPVTITRTPAAAALTFVVEGVRHILAGPDHVLFVLCLVLGTSGVRSLISRVTGFTVGHSVTLTAGFFGYVPAGGWFVPVVETGIALSIIYAAAIALLPPGRHARSERAMFAVTCAIGFLHGLGFSFVLQRMLSVDAPNLWQSLLAFNVGVELGQLAIIAVALPVLLSLRQMSDGFWRVGRIGLATGCIAVAAVWTAQRVLTLVEMA